ncbi:hypothetical protein ACXYMU_09530 [Pontibacter sp. CAU 1760]
MSKRIFSCCSLFFLLLLGCQQRNENEFPTKTTTATLLWTGEIAADGCGFEVLIDGKKYLPENEEAIAAMYKESPNTTVQLTYAPLHEPIDRRCGMLPQPRVMEAIRIISIERP